LARTLAVAMSGATCWRIRAPRVSCEQGRAEPPFFVLGKIADNRILILGAAPSLPQRHRRQRAPLDSSC